jgi:hypothetical protein
MSQQWGMERDKGLLMTGAAVPTFVTGVDWYAQGIVLRPGRLPSMVEVKRIPEPIVNSKGAAAQHGLALCKAWMDTRP